MMRKEAWRSFYEKLQKTISWRYEYVVICSTRFINTIHYSL
jgi:hypothetical protein